MDIIYDVFMNWGKQTCFFVTEENKQTKNAQKQRP